MPISFLRLMSLFSWQRAHMGQNMKEIQSLRMEPCGARDTV